MKDGLKKMNDLLAGVPLTALGGFFLILSFVLPRVGIALAVDPAWVTVFISGIPLLYLAVWRIIHNPGIRKISSALLITIAMFAAIAIGDLFAAGEVAFIMAVGAILEDMTTERAKKGLKKLISLAPLQGRRMEDGRESMIPADEIRCGDILRVLPGESIPVDAVIVDGETSVDQSIMTGESLPVDKAAGDSVFGGTINRFGTVDIRATKVGEDGSLQKLIRMVQEAEKKQAPTQRIADRCASILVPVALGIAVIAGLVTQDIVRAVTVLVVFCPCALVLATPTAIMAAIGQATKHGVIIKSGEALERMGKVDTIAFDKTGTLTYGRLEVSDVLPAEDETASAADAVTARVNREAPASAARAEAGGTFPTSAESVETERIPVTSMVNAEAAQNLLSLAASAEAKSEHPLAKAIVSCAEERNIAAVAADNFRMRSGKGVTAEVLGKRIFCGNEKYLEENDITITGAVSAGLEKLRAQGKASVLVAQDSRCIGIIALTDVLRPQARAMVAQLNGMNTQTVLLTGDNQMTADYFAALAGISEVRAGLLPEEKVKNISELQESGRTVCMIGDGVNDAPALKTAAVGVAMGSMGSDIAVEASDIALIGGDISRIPYLKRLANATMSTIKCSITLSMCINFAAVTLSVLGVLTPTTGALVHNAGSCFVVLIAALLYDRKFE